jgi:hypothetical protein
MLQDLEAGKPLELGCLNLGIAVPNTRAVHACAKLLDTLARERADSLAA